MPTDTNPPLPALASALARVALGHVSREYPNKLDHVLRGRWDLLPPRRLHPAFYGSFDWHSCVHGYWLLTRLYRRFPALPEAAAIRADCDAHLTPDAIGSELAYLREAGRDGFERPYGWAWLLMLAAELVRHTTEEGQSWRSALQPLAEAFVARFRAWLPKATYPIRAGTHSNSAFAFALALEYAATAADAEFAAELADKAQGWFGNDADCQAWEPGGEDFLSPALMEAECMRRVLPTAAFRPWLARFLPRLAEQQPATLFTPVTVSDRSDGRIAHLDGLNLSRAWCFRALAGALEPDCRAGMLGAAQRHMSVSLPHLGDHYMGEHWLATFALLALDDA